MAKKEPAADAVLTPQLLKIVEDMFAEGLTLQDIAELHGLPFPVLRGFAGSNIEFRNAMKAGEARASMVNLDKKRRSKIEQQGTFFIPTDDDLSRIEELARLGWPEHRIAESFELPIATWLAAKGKYPKIKDFLERGQAQAGGKLQDEQLQNWRPTPEQLEKIQEAAAKGYTPEVISRELGLGARFIRAHMHTLPEVRDAYCDGLADWEKGMTDKLMKAIEENDKYAQSNIMYVLKARKKQDWHDGAPQVQAPVQVDKQTMQYKIPQVLEENRFQKKAEQLRKAKAKAAE